MLIALLTIFFLGGSSAGLLGYIADTQDSVILVMAKDQRQKEALTTLKAMKKRTSARNKQVGRSAKDLDKAFRNHDTFAAEIDAIWVGHFDGLSQYNHDMLDLRFELKEHISREEWEAIFPER